MSASTTTASCRLKRRLPLAASKIAVAPGLHGGPGALVILTRPDAASQSYLQWYRLPAPLH
jgi:hypothetical protein